MSEDEALQLKKDALWEVHQAGRHVACLKRKITVLMRSAAKAVSGWGNGDLLVVDGSLTAKYPDNSIDHDIEFSGSDVLKATLVELANAERSLADAKKGFDQLR